MSVMTMSGPRKPPATRAQVVEITAVVAMSTLANYVNEVTGTDIDFPRIARQAKAALTPVS